uniref:Uncharacterized protein n=1 Tax=Meloidogyne javanica TaxID=6303 RepID=A0A915LUA3_MELJA
MTKFIKSVQIFLFLLFLLFIIENVYCDAGNDMCCSYLGVDDENDTESDTDESDVELSAENAEENDGGYESDSSVDSLADFRGQNLTLLGHLSDLSDTDDEEE